MIFLRDTWIVFARAFRLSLRNPAWVIIGLMQPVLYLVLFGPLLESVAAVPGFPPGDAWAVFVPGLLIQLGMFGAVFIGFGLIAEWRAGVIERMRVTPASRVALIGGRVMHDVVVVFVQGAVLVLAALLFGFRAPFGAVLLGLVLISVLAAAFSSLSYAAALWLKSEDALAPLANAVALPLLLLSGILLPMSLAPGWLSFIADINPIKHVVDAARAIFRSEFLSITSLGGIVIAILLVLVSGWIGVWMFRREAN
ncbi:MAG: ABC transporter permease [Cucumibacter sp.]